MRIQSAGRGPRVIRVAVESIEPLTGTAAAETGQQVPFEGWLGLLGVLAELVGSSAAHNSGSPEAADGAT